MSVKRAQVMLDWITNAWSGRVTAAKICGKVGQLVARFARPTD